MRVGAGRPGSRIRRPSGLPVHPFPLASAIAPTLSSRSGRAVVPRAARDPAWARWVLTSVALAFLAFFLVLPLVVVFAQAFQKG